MEQKKVKAVFFNDPDRTREFTKVAFDMITHPQGWILADDQSQPEQKKTNPAVAPAVVSAHNDNEIKLAREEYKKVAGKDAPLEWNEPKLFIETQKAKKNPPAPVEPVKIEIEVEEIQVPTIVDLHNDGTDNHVKEEKAKRGRKPKSAATV